LHDGAITELVLSTGSEYACGNARGDAEQQAE
jgi:hypothetical protein